MNNFTFNGEHFLQLQGTAMGTRMVPLYVILPMDKLERQLLSMQKLTPTVWWRYIDNIFMIWPHGGEKLKEFIENRNEYHPTIKFTSNLSTERAVFLHNCVPCKWSH